nr:MAG TPA: hypothetical protein [Caudoviricetes sp.]
MILVGGEINFFPPFIFFVKITPIGVKLLWVYFYIRILSLDKD